LVVWEPAFGRGGIAKPLRELGHTVFGSDLFDYGDPGLDLAGVDFLGAHPTEIPTESFGGIITNPPFSRAAQFVERALEVVPYVAMLLRINFLESERRTALLESGHFARVHVFARRLPMMHRDNWTGKRSSSAVCYAWFIFDRNHVGSTTLHRISWKESRP
jgi:hypothetical protein